MRKLRMFLSYSIWEDGQDGNIDDAGSGLYNSQERLAPASQAGPDEKSRENGMCLAIPSQVVEVAGNRAKVEVSGNTIEADLSLVEGAGVGDWVLVHAGFAIEKLEPEDARETLRLFQEIEGTWDDSTL